MGEILTVADVTLIRGEMQDRNDEEPRDSGWQDLLALCDSHEALRARVAEVEHVAAERLTMMRGKDAELTALRQTTAAVERAARALREVLVDVMDYCGEDVRAYAGGDLYERATALAAGPVVAPPTEPTEEDVGRVAMDRLRDAIETLDKLGSCQDNGCMFVPYRGMGTNGGCRCLGRHGDHRPFMPSALAGVVKAARAAIAAMKEAGQ